MGNPIPPTLLTPPGAAISVLGGGWVGAPLARHLHRSGYQVRVSRTTLAGVAELAAAGLAAFQVALGTEAPLPASAFWESPTLLITVPPQRGQPEAAQLAQFSQLVERLRASPVRHVRYISSTSVYAETNQVVTEADPPAPTKPGGRVVHQIEELLRQQTSFQTTVLRFGGLVGYDRLPGPDTLLAGRNRALGSPMNVIHRDDCVRIIHEIVRQGAWGEVFNACADEHPLRRDYYAAAASAAGQPLPPAETEPARPYKIVRSEKLKAALGYQFLYPNPLALVQPGGRAAG